MLGYPELLAIIERPAREQPRSLQTVDKLLIVRVPATECVFCNIAARRGRGSARIAGGAPALAHETASTEAKPLFMRESAVDFLASRYETTDKSGS